MFKQKTLIIIFLITLFSINIYAYNISGIIVDIDQNTPLAGANIQIIDEEKYTYSNKDGYFDIRNIESSKTLLKISFIGYKTQVINLDFSNIINLNKKILLSPSLIKFEAVRITITKSDKQLSNSSLPIASINSKNIIKKLPNNISSAISSEPGISMTSDGVWGKSISIRGLSKNNVAMMVDGNRISIATSLAAALSLININDVEKIETIKSGASSLYGSGATGGVINIISKKAHYNENFYIKPTLNTGFSSVNNMLSENLSILTGARKWNLKLTLQNRKADDSETPSGTLENSQFEDKSISANLNISPIKNHEISFNYQNFIAKNVGIPGGKPLFPTNADVRYVEANRELYSVNYTIKNILPVLTKISFKVYQQNIFRDVENIPHLITLAPAKEIHVLKIAPYASHKTTGFQIQSNWVLSEENYLTAGIDGWQKNLDSHRKKYLEIHVLNANNKTVKTINKIVGELPLPNSSYQTAGLYFNDDHFFLNKKLIMNIGGRYDFIKIESKEVKNPDFQIIDGVRDENPSSQKVFWEAEDDLDYSWSTNIGLLYKPQKKWNISFNLSKSFRSPTLEERFNYLDLGSLIKLGNPDLDSEISISKDFGVKYIKENFIIGGNIFHNNMSNLVIETVGEFNGKEALIKNNAGEAILYGYELFGSLELPYNFSISSNIAYVYGEDIKNEKALAFIPPLNGQLFLNYHLRNLLNFTAEINSFAKQDRIDTWEMSTSGYTYYNLYMYTSSFTFLNTQNKLFFRIDNVTDKDFHNHLSTNRGSMQSQPGRNLAINWQIEL